MEYSQLLRLVGGTGIAIGPHWGDVAVDSATLALINGAQQKTDNVEGTIITRSGTTTELGTQFYPLGELLIDLTSNTLKRGDGSTLGGIAFSTQSMNAVNTVWVFPSGATPADNGLLLQAGYAAAKAITNPGGTAISTTNRVTLCILPGVYDVRQLTTALTFDTEFVDIIGTSGSDLAGVVILTGGTAVVNGTASKGVFQSANDVVIRNITFAKLFIAVNTPANAVGFTMSNATHSNTVHENLTFFCDTGFTSSIALAAFTGSTSFGGLYRNIRVKYAGGAPFANAGQLYGAYSSPRPVSAIFENCEGPYQSFGMNASTISNYNIFTGRWTNVKVSGLYAGQGTLNIGTGAIVERSYIKPAATNNSPLKVTVAGGNDAIVRYNTIVPTGSGFAISRTGSETGLFVVAHHNAFPVNGIDTTNITNRLGTDAAAFNIVNASIT